MALITCPDCGHHPVSDRAEACPKCGCPILGAQSGIESSGGQVLEAVAHAEPLTPPNGFVIKVGVALRTNLAGGESSPVQRLEVTFDGKPIASHGYGLGGETFGPIPYELGKHSIRISALTRKGSRIMDHTLVVNLNERGRKASYRFAMLRISLGFDGDLESAELDPAEVGQIH